MSIRRLLAVVAAVLVACSLFLGGVIVGGHPEATGLTRLSDPLRGLLLGDSGQDLPSQILEALRDEYYEPVEIERLERTSAEAIVESLGDPYTAYLDPDELEAQRERNEGAYFGVGLQVAQRDEAVVVTGIFPGGPAASGSATSSSRASPAARARPCARPWPACAATT